MASGQIATVLIPALVIQQNNQQFIENLNIVGKTLDVPCRNVFIDEVGYWAIPIKNDGVFQELYYKLQVEKGLNGTMVAVPQPTFDSFSVFRVRDKQSGYSWWIYGTKEQFIASCATCCGSGTVPMPGIDGQFIQSIAPCQEFCRITNVAGAYQAIFAIPNAYGPDTWYPYGSYQNIPFPSASPAGYATPALLLAYLNATWNNPSGRTLVWTLSADNLTLTVTGGLLADSICIAVVRIGPSS